MSELTLTLIKLGFLALLWMFVLAVLSVIRSDLFGAKVDSRISQAAAVPQNSRTPKAAKPAKKRKGLPGSVSIADGPQADVGSTNGTYLDGQRVTRPVPAEIGGSIRIGRTTLNIAK